MSQFKNLLAGLAGAIALNILHESIRKTNSNVPRIDLLGEEALQKTLHQADTEISDKDHLYKATLAGDILSNAIYFSLIGTGKEKSSVFPKAAIIGLSAGIGAITLPKPLGLDPAPVTRTTQIKVMTVGYYVFGALVTGLVLKLLNKK